MKPIAGSLDTAHYLSSSSYWTYPPGKRSPTSALINNKLGDYEEMILQCEDQDSNHSLLRAAPANP